jgi:elongation factor Ts
MTRQEGKHENIIEKIAEGKLNKFFKENTLLSQEFIRDTKISVAEYLKQTDVDLTCCCFYRLHLGA